MFTPTLVGLLLAPPSVGLPPADAAAVEAAALANRRAIRTAHVVVRQVIKDFGEVSETRAMDATIWLDGDKLRCDYIPQYPVPAEESGKRVIECFHCERRDYHLYFIDLKNVSATLKPRSTTKFAANMAFDPRMLGYVSLPIHMLRSYRLDQHIGRSDHDKRHLSTETVGGVRCQVVKSMRTINGSECHRETWFDPIRGHHPLRMVYHEPKYRYRQEMVVDPQPVGGGLWYPKTVKFTDYAADKLRTEDLVEVKSVTVNQPIPPETFMFKGMDLPNNTSISMSGVKGNEFGGWVWRDGRLVDYPTVLAERAKTQPYPIPVPLHPPNRPRYWLYAAAGVLVVAAGYFLWRIARPRPT